jgi:hypothetical protein
VASLSYGPLMLVAAAVAVGQVFTGRIATLPLVVMWFVAGFVVTYATLLLGFFLVQGKRWATKTLVVMSVVVTVMDLLLCWLLLGTDGLLRDGGPLLFAALLTLLALARAQANGAVAQQAPGSTP